MHSKQLLNYFAGCESFFCSVHVMTIPYTHRKHRSSLKLCSNTHPGPSQILVDFNMPSAWLRRSQIYFIITNQWKNPYLQHWQSVENILNTKFLRIKINLITSKSRGNTLLCREIPRGHLGSSIEVFHSEISQLIKAHVTENVT